MHVHITVQCMKKDTKLYYLYMYFIFIFTDDVEEIKKINQYIKYKSNSH